MPCLIYLHIFRHMLSYASVFRICLRYENESLVIVHDIIIDFTALYSNVSELGHHWFRWWLIVSSAPKHYLIQCWLIVNWIFRNKFQKNSIYKCIWNVIFKMSAISLGLRVLMQYSPIRFSYIAVEISKKTETIKLVDLRLNKWLGK